MRHRPLLNRRWLSGIALSALVAGSAMWFHLSETRTEVPFEPGVTREVPQPATTPAKSAPETLEAWLGNPDKFADVVAARTPASLGPRPFATSLEGTEIDGALKADHNGELIVDLETRDFFDYFMSTVGEVPPEVALEQVRALAYNNLPESAARQAMAILDQYLHFKEQAVLMQQRPLDPSRQSDPAYQREMLQQAFAELRQLRQSIFSPDVRQAFFGLEEAYGEYTLATIDLASREDLGTEAKAALATWHRNQLPEPLRVTEQEMLASQQENLQRMDIIESSVSAESAGQQLLERGMSPVAAAEVTSYLNERDAFEKRFDQFKIALSQLETSGLAPEDEASQTEELIQRHFPDQKLQTWARLQILSSN
ncbi:lipase secretion chaperone [Marinobacter sp. chi1]|uniref:Lipase chaperone n=1 Tax=Marinobacter suaedae TaxID=3057675 RepID=A0ABT8VYM3_9GAMM|nr:lipase secretion chaperone [Marinobacter sp. chi1]MDO3721050.1 lipase secretion chaperone [Marinobacter sp. chi1]